MPGQSDFSLKLRLFSLACAFLSALMGAIALAGWAFELAALKILVPGFGTMKASTALCFVLSGVALFLLNSQADKAWGRVLGAACGWIVVAIAVVASSRDSGIDRLNFALAGTALLLLRSERRFAAGAAQWLAAAVLCISGLVVLAYVNGAAGRLPAAG
jgi:hypothetical protein